MKIKFKSKISHINKKGIGFMYLPNKYQNRIEVGQQLRVIINYKTTFFTKLRATHKKGIYIPTLIIKKNNLLRKETTIIFEKVNGFFTKTSNDGMIYLPQQEAERLSLKQNELILIEGEIKNKRYLEFCQLKIRKRQKTTEYFCMFNPKLIKEEGIFKIKSIISRNKFRISKNFKSLLKDFNYGFINKKNILIYYGNRVPIIININFNINEIDYYLGCYFADGTKKGNSWGICASTFEQGKFYLKMHNYLIVNNNIIPNISFTDTNNINKNTLKNKLTNRWKKKLNISIEEERTRIIDSKNKPSKKTNPFGSLILKEHKQLSLIYYNRLLELLFKSVEKHHNQKLALNFILGVLEGDGSAGAQGGHIIIASNKNELNILEKIIKISGFKFRKYMEGKNKGCIFIGSLEIIKNIPFLKNKLFKYYPKRRKILKERLAQTGCARFLLGKSKKTSNWLIGQLNKYGILDGGGNLTKDGFKIKRNLKEFLKEIK